MATQIQKLTLAEIRQLLTEAKREARAVLRDYGEGRRYLNAMAAVRDYQRLHDKREWEEIQAERREDAMARAEEMGPDELAGMVHGDKGGDKGTPWEGLLP